MSQDTIIKILIVDDEKPILEILSEVLDRIGADVYTAMNGEEGFNIYLKERPQIVITDIYMPIVNGLRLLSKIKKISPDTPVILITGYAHYRQLISDAKVKPDGFLEKPFDLRKIIELVLHYFPQLAKK